MLCYAVLQVEPALQAGLESLKAESKDGADWVLLYSPMVKFLFSSFEAVLQVSYHSNSMIDH